MNVTLPPKLLRNRADVGFVRCLVVDLLVVRTWLSGRRRGLSRWFDRLSSGPIYDALGMDYGGEQLARWEGWWDERGRTSLSEAEA